MGQNVDIKKTTRVGEILFIDTDRSFTGQDGHVMTPDLDGEGVPGVLASRLFGLDLGIDHVFVLQNAVTVRRPGGWTDESSAAVAKVTESFLRYYEDGPEAGDEEE
jgi:hypothetical protein